MKYREYSVPPDTVNGTSVDNECLLIAYTVAILFLFLI